MKDEQIQIQDAKTPIELTEEVNLLSEQFEFAKEAVMQGRRASTNYVEGDIVNAPFLPDALMRCTAAGTTSAEALTKETVAAGGTFVDGTVTWTVYSKIGEGLAREADTGIITNAGVTSVNGETGDVAHVARTDVPNVFAPYQVFDNIFDVRDQRNEGASAIYSHNDGNIKEMCMKANADDGVGGAMIFLRRNDDGRTADGVSGSFHIGTGNGNTLYGNDAGGLWWCGNSVLNSNSLRLSYAQLGQCFTSAYWLESCSTDIYFDWINWERGATPPAERSTHVSRYNGYLTAHLPDGSSRYYGTNYIRTVFPAGTWFSYSGTEPHSDWNPVCWYDVNYVTVPFVGSVVPRGDALGGVATVVI